jgi:hypothetical protein
MTISSATPQADCIVQAMIELARCSKTHRILVAGDDCPGHMFELHRRGFTRAMTTTTCGLPRGQYDVALVDWQLQSMKALETTLNWLVHFLAPASVLVVLVDSLRLADNQKLGPLFERLGFRIEAGTRCQRGIAIAARRREADEQAIAA